MVATLSFSLFFSLGFERTNNFIWSIASKIWIYLCQYNLLFNHFSCHHLMLLPLFSFVLLKKGLWTVIKLSQSKLPCIDVKLFAYIHCLQLRSIWRVHVINFFKTTIKKFYFKDKAEKSTKIAYRAMHTLGTFSTHQTNAFNSHNLFHTQLNFMNWKVRKVKS